MRINIVQLLIKSGIDVDKQSSADSSTVLHLALENRNENLIKMIIEHSNPNTLNLRNKQDQTPLYIAVENGLMNSARLLLSKGANVNDVIKTSNAENYDDQCILHCAVSNNDPSMVELLLKHGAKVNCMSKSHVTPFIESITGGFDLITFLLLENGADPNYNDSFTDQTPLYMAITYENEFATQCLLDRGADIIHTDQSIKSTSLQIIEYEYENDNTYNTVYPILLQHMAILKERGCSIGSRNEKVISKHQVLKSYYEDCLKEIQLIKSTKIYNYISFHDILFGQHNNLIKYLRNEKVMAVLKSGDYAKDYPIFSNHILRKFIVGRERLGLLNIDTLVLLSFIPSCLPRELATKICENLSTEDLKTLLRSYIDVAPKVDTAKPATMASKKRKRRL